MIWILVVSLCLNSFVNFHNFHLIVIVMLTVYVGNSNSKAAIITTEDLRRIR